MEEELLTNMGLYLLDLSSFYLVSSPFFVNSCSTSPSLIIFIKKLRLVTEETRRKRKTQQAMIVAIQLASWFFFAQVGAGATPNTNQSGETSA